MAILVTGGAGYIGSHTCVELLEAGYEVVVVDNFSNSHPESIRRVEELTGKQVHLHEVDLLDQKSMEEVFKEYSHNIEAVIHFAGLKAVGESVEKPLEYYHNNLTGTFILCELMNKYDVKCLVFSSSATVYGNPYTVPIKEDFPLSVTNPYGRTKLMIEEILTDLCKADKDFSVALLRYFNPIGAHESGRIGESPNGIPNNLMPYITQVAIGKREKLSIFGDDYDTPDGTGVRDYIHVVDLAKGHLCALGYVMKEKGIETFNLGTGRGYSVLELVHSFEEATGTKVPYKVTDRRSGDIGSCYADAGKAEEKLLWKAERGLKEMCQDAWRWQKDNPNGYTE